LNYFLPIIKLIDKTRAGSKVRKVYDQPRSPCQRLLASPDPGEEVKAELRWRYQSYNPVLLHRAVQALMEQNRQKALMRQRPFGLDFILRHYVAIDLNSSILT
jgi:hypothetical protein